MVVWVLEGMRFSREAISGKEQILRLKFYHYANQIKGFVREALVLSVHSAELEAAATGGEITMRGTPRTWICNGVDTSPKVDEVRYFLSNKTTELLNEYVWNFKIEDLPIVSLSNFTCVDYDVNEEDVFSGKVDEEFDVGAYGFTFSVTYGGNSLNSSGEVYDKVTQNRFWYLYRNFKDWVSGEAPKFQACICSCLPKICSCGGKGKCIQCPSFYRCVKNCISKSLNRLKNRFDRFVECTASMPCCIYELDVCEERGRECRLWKNPWDCKGCDIAEAGDLCSEVVLETKLKTLEGEGDQCEGACEVWGEPRAALRVTFSCTDKKYGLSTSGQITTRRLKFIVGATSNVKGYCYQKKDCICWPEYGERECKCPLPVWCAENCRGECEYIPAPEPPTPEPGPKPPPKSKPKIPPGY